MGNASDFDTFARQCPIALRVQLHITARGLASCVRLSSLCSGEKAIPRG